MLKAKGCNACQDTGMLHPQINGVVDYSRIVYCECVKTELAKMKQASLLQGCNFPPFASTMTFESFDKFPAVKVAYQVAKQMGDNPGNLSWLTLIGDNGCGKTHLAIAICKMWVSAGVPARYILTSLLLDELRNGFNQNNTENSYEQRFEYYCKIPLLMLDDFGLESKTPWVQEKLETLIDYRLMNNLSLIITSNHSLNEMPPRIASRLARHPNSQIICIDADDYKTTRGRING